MKRGRAAVLLAALAAWGLAPVALVHAKPPALTALEPAGARQGTTVLVSAAGSFDRWPARGWSDCPGITVEPAAEKGKLWVAVAEGTTPGIYWLRLHDEEGATGLRPFAVGTLPEVTEVEPNDDPGRAQPIDRPAVTVNGKLGKNGDVDGFAVGLKRGETLVASMEANRRLGSPMDGLLQVARPDGIVLAENDDDHDRDPQLVFQAPADGRYVVRAFAFPATPDARIAFSGGPTFVYRLTLTTRGFVDHPWPLAVAREAPGAVRVEGWNLEGDESSTDLRCDRDESATVARATRPGLANAVEVRVVPHAVAVEAGDSSADAPQDLTPPVSVTGRLDSDRDTDAYRFSARKGNKLILRVESRGLGQPLDPALRVLDASGGVVAEVDDSSGGRDAEIAFTAPSDGRYRAVVRDLNGRSGLRAVYLLTVAAPVPDVRLTVAADRFTLTPGQPLKIPVTLARSNGHEGTVRVSASGLPEGVTAGPVASESKGATARAVTLTFTADAGAAPWSGPIEVVGRSEDGSISERAVEAKVEGLTATTRHLWLTVSKPTPPAKEK
jgi:hypothetical protein